MFIIYNFVLILLSVLLLPLILIAFILKPKLRAGFFEKMGFYKGISSNKNVTAFHAVSVGETNAIKELVVNYRNLHPDETIILTTTTRTGQEIANKTLLQYVDKITYFPYDFFFSVLSFFNTYKPSKVIIAETEIWPCFVSIAKLKGIKIYTVNGRISPHSFEGYRKIKFLLSPILNKYEKIFMQSYEDSKKMIEIGTIPYKVEVMGNLKFDITQNLSDENKNNYRNQLKYMDYRVFVAASTHSGEDSIVINSFLELKKQFQDAKLLIAPRHPERYGEVSELLNKTCLNWGKRSESADFINNEIIMLDTMGELAKLFSISYIAFIGGSFSQTGGHNPLEASIWEKPVLSGPSTFNFKDVYKILTDKKAGVIVNNEQELTDELISFYKNSEKYNEFCNNSKKVFEENKGAINYVLERV